MKHKRLWIPGPVEVHPDVLKAMSVPMVGHRSKDYSEIHGGTKQKLRKFFELKDYRVFLFTSSGTGAMEAAIRNLTKKRALSAFCGAFGKRWHKIAGENGKAADPLEVEWGTANKPEQIEEKVKTGKYDLVTVTHNETSTGVMNPIPQISEMMWQYPDALLAVDAVSSMAGVPILPEALGVDMLLASTQKAWGLPPGLAVVVVSPRALERAKEVPDRGHYFDLLSFLGKDDKDQTPETPAVSLIYALGVQLDRMFEEGLENRFRRHEELAERCRGWAREKFALFAEEGYESVTLTCIRNTRGISVAGLNGELAKRGAMISNGYGDLKEKTFRIAHMGDTRIEELEELLGWIDGIIK
ncbi:MAG: pyridoxal-phosphate-dependent aminotransferase family protein [Planctomycetota bacterium]|jgi:predicted phosphoserine aminotransferase